MAKIPCPPPAALKKLSVWQEKSGLTPPPPVFSQK
jgi:hypothetical protein